MTADPRDYKLDLSTGAGARSDAAAAAPVGKAFLMVHFACCGAYQRIYRHASGADYRGRCPRCGRAVRFVIGEGGTAVRSFVVE